MKSVNDIFSFPSSSNTSKQQAVIAEPTVKINSQLELPATVLMETLAVKKISQTQYQNLHRLQYVSIVLAALPAALIMLYLYLVQY